MQGCDTSRDMGYAGHIAVAVAIWQRRANCITSVMKIAFWPLGLVQTKGAWAESGGQVGVSWQSRERRALAVDAVRRNCILR